MKKIYPQQWLYFHPYTKTDAVDRYYCDIVNKLMKVIYEYDVMAGDPMAEEGIYKDAAIFIGAWFEDVISQTGIWQVFTSECEKRYGSRLPFYDLDDEYYYDEINIEDIRFILWHSFQSWNMGVKVYNPENKGLENLAKAIYDILDKEYETAPENERLQEFFDFSNIEEGDYLKYRNKIEWFFMNCYINIGCYEDYLCSMDEIMSEYEDDDSMDERTKDIMLYSKRINTVLMGRTPLLGITAPEYIKLIQEYNKADHNAYYMNIGSVNEAMYTVESETNEYFVFKSLIEDNTYYKVTKESLELNSQRPVPGDTLVTSTLFKYGEYWYHNGAMMNYRISENPGMKEKFKELKSTLGPNNQEKVYKDFIKATKGKQFMFFKDVDEMVSFIEKKIKYKKTSDLDFSTLGDGLVMLSATPKNGLCFMKNLCDCVASPDNPYYNQEQAEKKAMGLLTDKNSIPYEMSCYLLDNGCLKDAGLNSILGAEHGRELVRKNAQFLMDYFFNKCREKDYNDVFKM